ncbi:MFS transporter [Microbacterium sp. SL62]|nr:MFS transporter [Microbacterium sp. SL62]MCY1718657.1 MFS transporter [Microbacterium sp. SL62]
MLSSRYRWVSIGLFLLVMLDAFVALGVTTIMPTVSQELDGAGLYPFAFAGPMAVSVVGMVSAGIWCDRGNPRSALVVSVAIFTAGLAVVALAPSMVAFVSGRLVHGLAGGAVTVALYVVVARVYPQRLHAKVFAAFATAWIIPSLLGPVAAGVLAETIGWRWVFFGVVTLVLLAMLIVVPAMRAVRGTANHSPLGRVEVVRIGLAVIVAAAALVIAVAAELRGLMQSVGPIVAAAIVLIALRPLMPAGTLRARRGLPSVVLLRALIAATFFAAEVYVPLLLITHYGASAALAGLALTAGALSWSAASWVQGRFPQIGHVLAARIGATGLSIGVGSLVVAALVSATPVVVVIGWAFAGAGIGLIYPRLGVLALGYSTEANQGFNSSALTIGEATASAIALAFIAVVFSAFGGTGTSTSFAAVFALAGALCALGWLCSPRIASRCEPATHL